MQKRNLYPAFAIVLNAKSPMIPSWPGCVVHDRDAMLKVVDNSRDEEDID